MECVELESTVWNLKGGTPVSPLVFVGESVGAYSFDFIYYFLFWFICISSQPELNPSRSCCFSLRTVHVDKCTSHLLLPTQHFFASVSVHACRGGSRILAVKVCGLGAAQVETG